jgi:ATP-dependent Clp protease ATP-binding subunit ClpA
MYERFTDRARKVMQLANREAQRFNHEYIGTEHILLGLVAEGSGVAANVLKNLDVDLRKIRLELEQLIKSGPNMVTMGKLPQTPRARKVIEYAMEESRNLGHNYFGTEHLLLGVLREQDGVAAHVLTNLGLKLEEVRGETLNLLGHGLEAAGGTAASERFTARPAEAPLADPPLARHVLSARVPGRIKHPAAMFDTRPVVILLAWMFLGLGFFGVGFGVATDQRLTLPGAILAAAGLIALALCRR